MSQPTYRITPYGKTTLGMLGWGDVFCYSTDPGDHFIVVKDRPGDDRIARSGEVYFIGLKSPQLFHASGERRVLFLGRLEEVTE